MVVEAEHNYPGNEHTAGMFKHFVHWLFSHLSTYLVPQGFWFWLSSWPTGQVYAVAQWNFHIFQISFNYFCIFSIWNLMDVFIIRTAKKEPPLKLPFYNSVCELHLQQNFLVKIGVINALYILCHQRDLKNECMHMCHMCKSVNMQISEHIWMLAQEYSSPLKWFLSFWQTIPPV
jgi:hypothetical protein